MGFAAITEMLWLLIIAQNFIPYGKWKKTDLGFLKCVVTDVDNRLIIYQL